MVTKSLKTAALQTTGVTMLQGSFEVVNFAMGRMSSCPVTFKQRDETVVGCSGRVDQEGRVHRVLPDLVTPLAVG